MNVDPRTARRTWRSMEAVHGMIYFTPHAATAYEAIGVTGRSGYFGSRSAPMGAVDADVVIATFYNFQPGLVRRAMTGLWDAVTPTRLLEARLAAVDASLRQAWGDLDDPAIAEAATLLRAAAETAAQRPEGRPLFAGHAALPWPDVPHLALWHAQSLLREYRGDGHLAALVSEDLGGLDALVSHAASGDVPANVLQRTRAWSDDEWAAGVDSMAARGLVNPDGTFTDAGREQRGRIEATTDRLAAVPYAPLGEAGCARIVELGKHLSAQVLAAGLLTISASALDE